MYLSECKSPRKERTGPTGRNRRRSPALASTHRAYIIAKAGLLLAVYSQSSRLVNKPLSWSEGGLILILVLRC